MPRKPKDHTTFFQRGDCPSWHFRYYDEYKRRRWASAPTLTGAKQLRAKLVLEAKERKAGLKPSARDDDRRRLTVADLIERYRPEFEALKSARDQKRYAMVWKRELGDLLATEVRAGDIETWRREAKLKGLKASTVNNHTSFLRRMYNLGIRDEILVANPLGSGRVRPLKGIGKRDRILTPDEEKVLLPELPPVDRAAFVIGLYCGLRRGEVMKLRREHVNLALAKLKLPDTKSGDAQGMPLSGLVLQAILWLLDSHESEWLFPNRAGDGHATGDMLLYRLKKAAKKVGLEGVLVHTLRHSFVTRVVDQGENIGTAKALARHSTITMTDAYMHNQEKARKDAVERLAAGSEHVAEFFPTPSRRGHLRAL